jgi:hypothetical protein
MPARHRREDRYPGTVAIRCSADMVGGGLRVIDPAKADVRLCIAGSRVSTPNAGGSRDRPHRPAGRGTAEEKTLSGSYCRLTLTRRSAFPP